ncbi:hypothetical protein CsSME_00007204 [Camellia sinensis var. sinensis]
MKLLQALVPGCDKVTGKALVLDEIISYVRSLQYQVEVLSMKLASVNPMFYDFGMELDAFMVPHEESPLPNVQQCNSAQFTTPNSYPLLDSSSSSLLFDHQQEQIPNIFPQVERERERERASLFCLIGVNGDRSITLSDRSITLLCDRSQWRLEHHSSVSSSMQCFQNRTGERTEKGTGWTGHRFNRRVKAVEP